MPIYEYRCDNGHTFEVMQRMSDDPLASCNTCGATVQRVFHPVAVHFKGSGFYNTDYGKQKRGGGSSESKSESSTSTSSSDSTAGKTDGKESGSKDSGSSGSGSKDSGASAGSDSG